MLCDFFSHNLWLVSVLRFLMCDAVVIVLDSYGLISVNKAGFGRVVTASDFRVFGVIGFTLYGSVLGCCPYFRKKF